MRFTHDPSGLLEIQAEIATLKGNIDQSQKDNNAYGQLERKYESLPSLELHSRSAFVTCLRRGLRRGGQHATATTRLAAANRYRVHPEPPSSQSPAFSPVAMGPWVALFGGQLLGRANGYRGWHAAQQLGRLPPAAPPVAHRRADPVRPLAMLPAILNMATRGEVRLRALACLPRAGSSRYGPAGPGVATFGFSPFICSCEMNTLERTSRVDAPKP